MRTRIIVNSPNEKYFVSKHMSLVEITNKEPSLNDMGVFNTESYQFLLIKDFAKERNLNITLIPDIYQKGTYISTYIKKIKKPFIKLNTSPLWFVYIWLMMITWFMMITILFIITHL